MKRLMFAVAAVGLLATPAFAQQEKVIQEEDRTVFRKKTVVDFTDVQVEGELTKPEGSYQVSKKRTSFDSLIKVRSDFNPELQGSRDNL